MEQQNISYYPTELDHHSQANGDSQDQFHAEQVAFHSGSNFHSTNDANFVSGGGRRTAFRPSQLQQQRQQHIVVQQAPGSLPSRSGQQQQTVHVQLVPQQQGNPSIGGQPQQQHIIISAQPAPSASSSVEAGGDGNSIAAFMEYFVEQQQQPTCSSTALTSVPLSTQQYHTPDMVDTKFTIKKQLLTGLDKSSMKAEKDLMKRARQAEAARQRYHNLTPEQKKELNLKRTEAQKRKKQREKEMAELESILRASNDIVDDPDVLEQLREKRMRAKWAEAARTRYHRMSDDERRNHNLRRRMKQAAKPEESRAISIDDEVQRRMKEQNAKKAESARQRYHRMSNEEKKMYNQRRTEAFRRRRMEEEALLAMPIGRINGEALDRAQQIVIRNAKRAEAARLRYQRMTPEQRRQYNQKRYTPKRKRPDIEIINADSPLDMEKMDKVERDEEEEYDALSSLERDVVRRTQQAQQALMRQRVVQPQTTTTASSYGGSSLIQSSSGQQQQQPSIQQLIHHQSMSTSGSPRSHQPPHVILHSNTGESLPQRVQLHYSTASSGNSGAGGTRILVAGTNSQQQLQQQQVTYVTSSSQQHQIQRAL